MGNVSVDSHILLGNVSSGGIAPVQCNDLVGSQRSRSRSISPDSSDFGNSPVKSSGKFRSPSRSPGRSAVKPSIGHFLAVSHLTRNVNEAHLKEIFCVYGEILAVSYPMHPNTGYPIGKAVIEYGDDQMLNNAITGMNGGQIDGNVIECSISKTSSPFVPHNQPRTTVNGRRPTRGGRDFHNKPRRADHYAPGRRNRSRSPIRRHSFSPSRSPLRRRDSRSPIRRRDSRSPIRRRDSRSPIRRRDSRSPLRRRDSRSPLRRRNPHSPIRRRNSRSPLRRRSLSRSRSPIRRRSRSPSRSPPRRFRSISRSPPRRFRSISRSPPPINSRRRSFSRSPSRTPPRRFDSQRRPLSRSPPRGRRGSPSRRSLSRSPIPVSRMNH